MTIYYLIFIFLVCVLGILFVIGKKVAYLRRISPEILIETDIDQGFFSVFFKEVIVYLKSLNLRSHALKLLSESEKILRQIKLFFLRFERYISELILNIQEAVKEQERLMAENKRRSEELKIANELESKNSLDKSSPSVDKNVFKEDAADVVYSYDTKANVKESSKNNSLVSDIVEVKSAQESHLSHEKTNNSYKGGVVIESGYDIEFELKKEEQKLIMAIAKSPKESSLYCQLGDVCLQLGSLEEAKEAYQYCLKLDPDNYLIKTKLSKVLRNMDKMI